MPLENEKRKKYTCFGNVLTKLLWRSSLENVEDKVDLHLVNFSHTNDTVCWRMLSFQSPFEVNEIWIICKAKCFKLKVPEVCSEQSRTSNMEFFM